MKTKAMKCLFILVFLGTIFKEALTMGFTETNCARGHVIVQCPAGAVIQVTAVSLQQLASCDHVTNSNHGNCTQESNRFHACTGVQTCIVKVPQVRLDDCGLSNSLTISYICILANDITNICQRAVTSSSRQQLLVAGTTALTELTALHGYLATPGYPSLWRPLDSPCLTTISVPKRYRIRVTILDQGQELESNNPQGCAIRLIFRTLLQKRRTGLFPETIVCLDGGYTRNDLLHESDTNVLQLQYQVVLPVVKTDEKFGYLFYYEAFEVVTNSTAPALGATTVPSKVVLPRAGGQQTLSNRTDTIVTKPPESIPARIESSTVPLMVINTHTKSPTTTPKPSTQNHQMDKQNHQAITDNHQTPMQNHQPVESPWQPRYTLWQPRDASLPPEGSPWQQDNSKKESPWIPGDHPGDPKHTSWSPEQLPWKPEYGDNFEQPFVETGLRNEEMTEAYNENAADKSDSKEGAHGAVLSLNPSTDSDTEGREENNPDEDEAVNGHEPDHNPEQSEKLSTTTIGISTDITATNPITNTNIMSMTRPFSPDNILQNDSTDAVNTTKDNSNHDAEIDSPIIPPNLDISISPKFESSVPENMEHSAGSKMFDKINTDPTNNMTISSYTEFTVVVDQPNNDTISDGKGLQDKDLIAGGTGIPTKTSIDLDLTRHRNKGDMASSTPIHNLLQLKDDLYTRDSHSKDSTDAESTTGKIGHDSTSRFTGASAFQQVSGLKIAQEIQTTSPEKVPEPNNISNNEGSDNQAVGSSTNLNDQAHKSGTNPPATGDELAVAETEAGDDTSSLQTKTVGSSTSKPVSTWFTSTATTAPTALFVLANHSISVLGAITRNDAPYNIELEHNNSVPYTIDFVRDNITAGYDLDLNTDWGASDNVTMVTKGSVWSKPWAQVVGGLMFSLAVILMVTIVLIMLVEKRRDKRRRELRISDSFDSNIHNPLDTTFESADADSFKNKDIISAFDSSTLPLRNGSGFVNKGFLLDHAYDNHHVPNTNVNSDSEDEKTVYENCHQISTPRIPPRKINGKVFHYNSSPRPGKIGNKSHDGDPWKTSCLTDGLPNINLHDRNHNVSRNHNGNHMNSKPEANGVNSNINHHVTVTGVRNIGSSNHNASKASNHNASKGRPISSGKNRANELLYLDIHSLYSNVNKSKDKAFDSGDCKSLLECKGSQDSIHSVVIELRESPSDVTVRHYDDACPAMHVDYSTNTLPLYSYTSPPEDSIHLDSLPASPTSKHSANTPKLKPHPIYPDPAPRTLTPPLPPKQKPKAHASKSPPHSKPKILPKPSSPSQSP